MTPEELLTQIDGNLLKEQRLVLGNVLNRTMMLEYEYEALEGILNLMDAIADVCHDYYGMDTLLCNDDNGCPLCGSPIEYDSEAETFICTSTICAWWSHSRDFKCETGGSEHES